MKLPRPVIAIVCFVATFIATAGEEPTAKIKGAVNQPTAAELQPLQGTWEGAAVGESSHQRITVTITGNSLHFHRDADFWFETTITLPAGTDPKQLHATIKGCPPSQASSIGQVVGAIFKIEEGTLTLATGGDGAGEPPTPKSFEAAEDKGLTRYELRKVQPQKECPTTQNQMNRKPQAMRPAPTPSRGASKPGHRALVAIQASRGPGR